MGKSLVYSTSTHVSTAGNAPNSASEEQRNRSARDAKEARYRLVPSLLPIYTKDAMRVLAFITHSLEYATL
jgi:hypothetical protein